MTCTAAKTFAPRSDVPIYVGGGHVGNLGGWKNRSEIERRGLTRKPISTFYYAVLPCY
jgi:hypothetical protein